MMRAGCIFLFALAACDSKPAEPGSCFRPQENACIEHDAAHAAGGKRLCVGLVWTAGAGSCPPANRLGTCTKKDGAELLYAGPPNNYSAASAKLACEHGAGTFRGSGTSP